MSDANNKEGPEIVGPQLKEPYHARVGATVKMCSSLDPICADPLLTGLTDDLGMALFNIPERFYTPFLDISRPDIVPMRVYLNPRVIKDGFSRFNTGTLTPETAEIIAASVGAYQPQMFGPNAIYSHIMASATDCQGLVGGGVVLSIDRPGSKVVTFFVSNFAPSLAATETDPVTGLQFFLNVPVGQVTVTAKVAATGQVIGALNVYAPAGAFVRAVIAPTLF